MPSESVQTTAEFLKVLRASGLVGPDELDPVLLPWKDHAGPVPPELVVALVESGLVTQWHVEQLRKGRYKGFFLGKYRLLRPLGAGGMSSVYLAVHATLHNECAIKVLPLKRVDQTSFLARFENEARMTARLNHPNIARTFDLDKQGNVHFFAMEYVEGIDLFKKVKQEGPLSIHEAAEMIRQAANGLEYAHDEGFVHRDIKPANMMLDRRGTLKILDLGLGLSRGEGPDAASLTQEFDEKVLGTADYLAPEQIADSHNVDKRADIYSLGCTLYYLLVGTAPFPEGSARERFVKHLKAAPPNLLEKRPDTPPVIASLYLRMMQKKPEGRFQTAKEVADTLAQWLAENPAARSASEPSAASREAVREQWRRRAEAAKGSSAQLKKIAPPRLPARASAGGPPGGRGGDSQLGRSSGVSSSAIDPSQLSFTGPAPSGSLDSTLKPSKTLVGRVASPAAAKRAGGGSSQPAAAGEVLSGGAPLSAADRAKAYRAKKARGQLFGLPIAAWAMIAAGLVAVAVAVGVFMLRG